MHNHHHHDCHGDHALKFCKTCSVVYCQNCHKEWRENWWTYTAYPNATTTYPIVRYDTNTGTNALDATTTVACSHN